MRRVEVVYIAHDTVCTDVFHTGDNVNSTLHPDGRALVKTAGETRMYAQVIRIRTALVDEAGPELDMA